MIKQLQSSAYKIAGLLFISLLSVANLTFAQIGVSAQKTQFKTSRDDYYYNLSVKNAMYTAPSKICYSLIPVTDSNQQIIWDEGKKHLLVATWKSDSTYYGREKCPDRKYNTGNYEIWVSIAPQLKEKMKHVAHEDLDMRIRQLLGLPPSANYKYFITFWVSREDLFRPCPDDEITDSHCDLAFPPNADPAHIQWINQSRIDRFFTADTTKRYPWTQLGYTYDWSPKNRSHIGVSEFVIRKNATVLVDHIYTTAEYIYGK